MDLDHNQARQLHAALLSAFPSPESLHQLLVYHLDAAPGILPTAVSLDNQIFTLIQWAEAQGKVEALLKAAFAANPGNQAMYSFLGQIYAFFTIGAEKRLFNPSGYPTFNALTTGLFLQYLTTLVDPITYEADWVIMEVAEPQRVLAPLAWAARLHGRPAGSLNEPLYTAVPAALGIVPGSKWTVVIKKPGAVQLFDPREIYGLAVNDPELVWLLRSPKGSYAARKRLIKSDFAAIAQRAYRSLFVYHDWSVEMSLGGALWRER